MKESYQRSVITVTEFFEDDVIVTSGTSDPGPGGGNSTPLIPGGSMGGTSSGSNSVPGGFY